MTVYNELNKIAYIGNTSQTLYPIPFEYINTEDIKVSIYTSKNEFVEDWIYSTQYVIEGGNVKVLSGYAIDKNKKLLILRRVDLVQDNKYREGGDFPAKSTEASFDKLTMITQQLQETLDRCVKVEVLDIQTPDELLEEVYNKLDSATEVAEQAIGAANQATTAAKDAKDAVVVAQQQITETQAFIEQARADINQTVEDSIEYVEQEAVKAATEVVADVVGQYTERAETAAKNAEADASRTAESANQASASATSAATSASEAEAIAGEISVYNFKNKITNCITEIPQDIKLEFTGSNMILKAGSKVTFGDGTSITINVDKNIPFTITSADKYVVCYTKYSNSLTYNRLGSQTASGTTTPTSGYWVYYNTTDKKVYDINNGVNAGELSLPLCIFSSDTSSITSIDQVFNGFGYIGSTVYALPGVKGLIPNGRNEDGSLKNIEFTVSSVVTKTQSTTSYNRYLTLNPVAINTPPLTTYEYDELNNITKYNGAKASDAIVGQITCLSGVITSLQPKLPFRAADVNEIKDYISSVELPTGTVIAFAANSTPSGYLLCNGATVSRTTYADLFAVIGTTYGTGDGSKTFALPNLTDKFIMGSGTAGTSKEAGLPNIIGAFALQNDKFVSKSGAFTAVTDSTRYTSGINSGGSGQGGVNFNASNSNSIYGKSSTVQPPALTMCFYIKY